MKIKSIKPVGRRPVYDLSVQDTEHYVLKNGVVTHNTGIMYSANQVFIITKSQEKEGDNISGFKFTINIEKSRYVKEKSKLPFTVYYDTGIQKWSSLFEIALEAGMIIKPKVGWYQLVDPNTGEVSDKNYREKEIKQNNEFFEKIIKEEKFIKLVEKKYKMTSIKDDSFNDQILDDVDIEEEIE